jgi:hypothetical protein
MIRAHFALVWNDTTQTHPPDPPPRGGRKGGAFKALPPCRRGGFHAALSARLLEQRRDEVEEFVSAERFFEERLRTLPETLDALGVAAHEEDRNADLRGDLADIVAVAAAKDVVAHDQVEAASRNRGARLDVRRRRRDPIAGFRKHLFEGLKQVYLIVDEQDVAHNPPQRYAFCL